MSMIVARILSIVKMPNISSLSMLQKFVTDRVSKVMTHQQTAQIESIQKPQAIDPKRVMKTDAQYLKELEESERVKEFCFGKKFRCGEPLELDLRKKPFFSHGEKQAMFRRMLSDEMTERRSNVHKKTD